MTDRHRLRSLRPSLGSIRGSTRSSRRDARPELLSDRFGITEGPVWIPEGREGFLLVSDLTANAIYKITPDKRVSVFLEQAGYSGNDIDSAGMQSRSGREHVLMIGPSCTAVDAAGRLLWCADNDGAIMRLEKDYTRTVVAGTVGGKRFNGPQRSRPHPQRAPCSLPTPTSVFAMVRRVP